MRRLLALAPLLFALNAHAVTIDWVPVAGTGTPNVCDPQSGGCFGSVAASYLVGKYEITNAQYVEFLNAVAASDPNGVYNAKMTFDPQFPGPYSGIDRFGSPGSYSYAVISGFENKPVAYVSYYDALRFANWLNNGQPVGPQGPTTTEDGSYTFTGPTTVGERNPGAIIVLPSENEWYKAAYYSPVSATYFDYPTSTNATPACVVPSADTGNSANCGAQLQGREGFLSDVGAYAQSKSPSGTYDQGGNVYEWNETLRVDGARGFRGGAAEVDQSALAADARGFNGPMGQERDGGFRLAMVPEPSTGLLAISGVLGLAAGRRRRPSANSG